MKKEIILKNVIVTLLALIIFAVFFMFIMDYYTKQQSSDSIINLAEIYKKQFSFNAENDYSTFTDLPDSLTDIRVTIIDKNGKVLSDSNADENSMENHSGRPEFIAAINDNPQVFIRNSDTVGIDMMYYAVKVYKEDRSEFIILRVAQSISNINSYIFPAIPVIIVLIITIIGLSIFITIRLNKSLLNTFKSLEINLKKINEGTYQNLMPNYKQQELNFAIIGLNDIHQKIIEDTYKINKQTQKLDYVLENIEQGIIAVDAEMNLIFINACANRIFNISSNITDKNLLYTGCDNEFYEKVSNAVKGKGEKSFEISYRNRIYSVNVSVKNYDILEAIVILSDITAIKRMESLRSDFFANASHELKTPITSIVGFSELLENENNTENIKKYVSYIIKDSRRMLRLIDDMLKLSKLDSNVEQGKKQYLELSEIAKEVKEGLSIMAADKKVTVGISGEAKIYANRENIYELLENLVSNAIRYNNENGKVDIILYTKNTKAVIEVIDNGIGIEKIYQDRIFERFYRVDKGRSKNTGGTGLGLSIVKHIVSLYNGTIELESELHVGTKIRVIL